MGLWDDFKAFSWPKKLALIGASLAGLAGTGYFVYANKGGSLETSIEESYKPGKNKEGKNTYTFKINDNQREGYTISFGSDKALDQFNKFITQYVVDHEEELHGRDYLTQKEAWNIAKLIDSKKRPESIGEITEVEMDDAKGIYCTNKDKFKITFDLTAPRQPGKAVDLMEAAEMEYNKIIATQDRELQIYGERKGMGKERLDMLRKAADLQYRNEIRSDPSKVRAPAEFSHYRGR